MSQPAPLLWKARLGSVAVIAATRRSDAALVRAAQRGSADAVEALFERHWPALHHAAFLVVRDAAAAEDIAQEAFLAALRALHGFDRRRPLGPWLHRIAVNRAIDHARARSLRRETDADPPADRVAAPVAHDAFDDEVLAALGALDADQRAVVVLRHLLEYTPGEIAELLDIPRGTVNSRLRRALDTLAGELRSEVDP
jgi:RNA polymerase sigma-70 factor (ECF subfamily)